MTVLPDEAVGSPPRSPDPWRHLVELMARASHIDAKHATSDRELAEVLAGAVAWPVLYRAVRLLSRLQGTVVDPTRHRRPSAEEITFAVGERVGPLRVAAAVPGRLVVLDGSDQHDETHLALVAAPAVDAGGRSTGVHAYALITVVRHKTRTGRWVFRLVRPLHHWVARGLLRAGTSR